MDKNKIKLFLDFDDTIVLTAKSFVTNANKRFGVFKDWRSTTEWSFSDLYPKINGNDITEIFESDSFFNCLELMDDCKKYINVIDKIVDISIITKGTYKNLEKKKIYLDKVFYPNNKLFNKNFIGISEDISKSTVDMNNAIFVDDRIDNLIESNASVKILFKNNNNFPWQTINKQYDNLYVVNTWKEIYLIVKFFVDNPEFIKRG